MVPSLPVIASELGWILASPVVHDWRQTLLDFRPSLASHVVLDSCPDGVLDFFTDGSCLWSTCAAYRVASWAVILAGSVSLSVSPMDAKLCAAGGLPGPFRAELFAVAVALQLCVDQAV